MVMISGRVQVFSDVVEAVCMRRSSIDEAEARQLIVRGQGEAEARQTENNVNVLN